MRTFLLAVALVAVLSGSDASKCNQDLIKKIEAQNKAKYITEKPLLELIKKEGKTAIVKASKGVVADNVDCVYTTISQKGGEVGVNYDYVNYLKDGKQDKGSFYVTEVLGHLENKWTKGKGKALRYPVYSSEKPGVVAWYKCEEEGPAGEDQGYVKVVLADAKDAQKKIDEAVAALAKLNIKATVPISTTCK